MPARIPMCKIKIKINASPLLMNLMTHCIKVKNFKYSVMRQFLLAVILGICSPLFGQEVELVSSTAGVFIHVVGNVSPDDRILVEKREGNRYRNLGEMAREDSPDDFISNYRTYHTLWTGYTTYTEQKLRGKWRVLDSLPLLTGATDQLEPDISLAFGLAVLDPDVTAGETHEYRITFPDGTQLNREHLYDPQPFALQIETNAYDNWTDTLELEWRCPFARPLAGYRVYRSEAGLNRFNEVTVRGGFAVMNNAVFFTAYDTSLHLDGFFDYYVQFLDTKGRISHPSDVFEVHTLNPQKRPILRNADVQTAEDQKALTISWDYSDRDKLVEIQLYRSLYLDRAFELRASLAPEDTSYTDPVEKSMIAYYYILVPVDYVGKGSQSPVLPGICKFKEKPLPPTSVKTTGIEGGVKVSWKPTGNNNRGFHVYRMEPGDSMQVLSGFLHNDSSYTFIDTMINHSVVRKYGYAVTSESDGYVQSELSDTSYASAIIDLEIIPPDEVDVRMREDGGITLFWDDDMIYDPHISGFNVYRKALDESTWVKVNDTLIIRNNNYWVDYPAAEKLIYYYQVKPVDVFDHEHPGGNPYVLKLWEHYDLRGPRYLKARTSNAGIILSWADLRNEKIEGFRVYRSEAANDFEEIALVGKSENNYSDSSVEPDVDYQYYVTALFPEMESVPSEKVLVSLP